MSAIRRASLDEIRGLKQRGELHRAPDAAVGKDLGAEFWAQARLEPAQSPRSVHLKLDPEVFAFFKSQGKGHLTKMQDVLTAYVRAHKHP